MERLYLPPHLIYIFVAAGWIFYFFFFCREPAGFSPAYLSSFSRVKSKTNAQPTTVLTRSNGFQKIKEMWS